MAVGIKIFIILILISNFSLLLTKRFQIAIRWIAIEALFIGIFPILLHVEGEIINRVLLLAGIYMFVRVIVIPKLLFKFCRPIYIQSELKPFIGFSSSLVLGLFSLLLSIWIANLSAIEPFPHLKSLLTTAYFLIFSGLLLMITRRKAMMQIIGFLTLENGIFLFGISVVVWTPYLLELGGLLDLFVAVVIMGIGQTRIYVQHNSTDVSRLQELKG